MDIFTMRMFYNTKENHLIITPHRNGSTHLQENMARYGLTEVTHSKLYHSIINDVEKKTFIYRDPCLRLISFYKKFIYDVRRKNTVSHIKNFNDFPDNTSFIPNVRSDILLEDILFAKDKIIENYKLDSHTAPQISYFKEFNQLVEEYEIISINQYVKWLVLTFADKTIKSKPSPIDEINITPITFIYMQKIQELCRILYKDDYELLEPRITYL